jgi:hypothetical protein
MDSETRGALLQAERLQEQVDDLRTQLAAATERAEQAEDRANRAWAAEAATRMPAVDAFVKAADERDEWKRRATEAEQALYEAEGQLLYWFEVDQKRCPCGAHLGQNDHTLGCPTELAQIRRRALTPADTIGGQDGE